MFPSLGIDTAGGGEDSSTNVTNNIQFSDFGAIQSGKKIALGGVTATWEENNSGASPLDVSIPAVSSAVISATRVTKRSTLVYCPSTNANNFRVGVGAAAGAGILLEPGMGIELEVSAAVTAYNEGAGAESLTVTELDRI